MVNYTTQKGPEVAIAALSKDQQLAATELLSAGINMNLGPLLDLDIGHNSVIERALLS